MWLLFEGSYYSRAAFISLESLQAPTTAGQVHTSDTVTTVRRCQEYAPLSPAVSRGNELYNTNSPSASPVIVVRNYLHTCACAAYSSHGYYSRAVFISLRAQSDCAATI